MVEVHGVNPSSISVQNRQLPPRGSITGGGGWKRWGDIHREGERHTASYWLGGENVSTPLPHARHPARGHKWIQNACLYADRETGAWRGCASFPESHGSQLLRSCSLQSPSVSTTLCSVLGPCRLVTWHLVQKFWP